MIIQRFNTQQTSTAAKAQEKEEEKEAKERKMKQRWVVPAALPSVTVKAVTHDMLKQLSWEVVQIILDCFHLHVLLVFQSKVRTEQGLAEVVVGWPVPELWL